MKTVSKAALAAWRWHIGLFAPPSPGYRYWFRVTFLWFVPICTLHQLAMSATYDPEGLSQRIVVSRIATGLITGTVISIGGWLACRAVLAVRQRA